MQHLESKKLTIDFKEKVEKYPWSATKRRRINIFET